MTLNLKISFAGQEILTQAHVEYRKILDRADAETDFKTRGSVPVYAGLIKFDGGNAVVWRRIFFSFDQDGSAAGYEF